ncbi:MAG: DUF4832 domain-containing protein [Planctomycetaceae bacterium]|nr:DUF4832 domain-containing protein [Planctomycetaceae bacterium]
MKTTRRAFLATAAGVGGSVALGTAGLTQEVVDAAAPPVRVMTYHGLRPTDPGGRLGLRNPERGWRIETIIAEPARKTFGPAHHLVGRVSPLYQEDWWILDAERFAPFGLTLVQAYCYLTEFAASPISDDKLQRLQASLDNLRQRGLKAVLRFAYERQMGLKEGPTLDWVLRHIDQLEPLVRRNVDVIYVLQAGFIGAWGEWHNAAKIAPDDYAARAAIVKRLLEALPEERMLQVRVPRYKRLVLQQPALAAWGEVTADNAFTSTPPARIGFHNDGFLAGPSDGGTWPEEPHFGQPGNPEFDYMTRESSFVAVDGELFWGDQGFDGVAARGAGVDGLNAAVRMRLHHYSSFSLAHSYSEREGKPYSIDYWLQTPVKADALQQAAMPLSDGWFADGLGQPAARSQFEYIQDHLGYRLELQKSTIPAQVKGGVEFTVEVELINRGFSTLHNRRPVCLTLIDQAGHVTELAVTAADPRQWQPFRPGDAEYTPLVHKITWTGTLPAQVAPGWQQIGLWLPDAAESLRGDARFAVRVANRDVPWWTGPRGEYGINLLGIIEIAAS